MKIIDLRPPKLRSVIFLMAALADFPRLAQAGDPNPWGRVTSPVPGEAQSIGSYESGCLAGAVALPAMGEGYRVMRLDRQRYYGHPVLVRFIENLGKRAAQQGFGALLIGDLGQPRGGPPISGHRSHQTGLDVDIWFQAQGDKDNASLSLAALDTRGPLSMLTADDKSINRERWSDAHAILLKTVQQFPEVARIFVNPLIKRELCRRPGDRTWLAKLRPWWGHDAHFHVRLACPQGNRLCVAQEPVPRGDGCDASLAWWLTEEAKTKRTRLRPAAQPLPASCQDILQR